MCFLQLFFKMYKIINTTQPKLYWMIRPIAMLGNTYKGL